MKVGKELFAIVVLLASLSGVADTEDVNGYTWTYRINGGTAEIYKDNGYGLGVAAISPGPYGAMPVTITIPSSLGGKPVTRIGKRAFYYCSSLSKVTIPSSVISIGESAFGACTGLKKVIIPSSITSIEARAFEYCYKLTEVTIPSGVTCIEDCAFQVCGDRYIMA